MSFPKPGVWSNHARDRLPSIRKMVKDVRDSIERNKKSEDKIKCKSEIKLTS